jgi:predicted MFS family arabinose efflux permease
MIQEHNHSAHPAPAAWGAIGSMTMCVALLIASEFMPVSLLTPIAHDLGATEGMAGQAISISGLFAVATSLLIATASGRLDRRYVLVGLTVAMLVSLALIATAPSFGISRKRDSSCWTSGRPHACHAFARSPS